PTSTLARLDDLITQASAAGLKVRAETEGAVRALPFGVDVAAYRIVQEALTNVARHAGPATATVRIAYGEDEVTVQVDDDGRGPGARQQAPTGNGIVRMRQREAAAGGTGRRGSAGSLPRAAAPAAVSRSGPGFQ